MSSETKTPETPTQTFPTDSRTGIQKLVEPLVDEAMVKAGLNMSDPTILRRYFRALMTIGMKRLLDAGAPPPFIVAQAIEAVGHEIEAREAAGTAFTVPVDPSEN